MAKYLDYDGLSYFWAKIKALINNVQNVVNGYTINGKKICDNPTLSATDVDALPITGGTITGTLNIEDCVGAGYVKLDYEGIKASDEFSDTYVGINKNKLYRGKACKNYYYEFPEQSGTLALTSDIEILGEEVANAYLPLTGGTINGPLSVSDNGSTLTFTDGHLQLSDGAYGADLYFPLVDGNLLVDKQLATINGESITDGGNIDFGDYVKSITISSMTTSGSGTYINGVIKTGGLLAFTKASIPNASSSEAGLMSAEDKAALDNVSKTYLPLTGGTLTGVLKTEYEPSGDSRYNVVIGKGGVTISLQENDDALTYHDVEFGYESMLVDEKEIFYPSEPGTLALIDDINSAIDSNIAAMTAAEITAICV